MLDTLHEIAIYIHRFHNLDLFQQGWYQIKVTMQWEDAHNTCDGIPSKVIQYEASPNLGSGESHGGWRIDDSDNSFFTPPFKIRYAKQNVPLSFMVSFYLSISNREVPSKAGVIIKFELMHASLMEKGSELQASLSSTSVAVHEFRIPPKGLLGLHSYCPVLFDAFYAVLVDTTIHVTLMNWAASNQMKVSSNHDGEKSDGQIANNSVKGFGKVEKEVMLVKALLTARDILLEEIQKLSKAIDDAINLTDFLSQLDDTKLFGSSSQMEVANTNSVANRPELADPQNSPQKVSVFLDFRRNGFLQSLSKDILLRSAHTIGNQIYYLWSKFVNFHRVKKTEITEYLQELWASNRKTEWSIWMVHSKVEMPNHFIFNGDDNNLNGTLRGKVSVLWRVVDDPTQTAANHAERHRRGIMHMTLDSRSIQDLQIFGDPTLIPIVLVERVINARRRSCSGNSYFGYVDQKATSSFVTELKTMGKISSSNQIQNARDLNMVVFVHGFQGHHLDLRLVRNQWLLIDPKAEFLMSEANEDKTSGDFREMGNRLAKEVILFFKKKLDKISRHGGLRSVKLSFVGHSIGNVIIRTALADSLMEPYLRFLYTYVSISGPHLGYLFSSNTLFNSGLWLLKKLKSTQCMHQLTFTDDPDLQKTFFFKLCQQKTLENFKNIILLSSPQDRYVPYHSARIELCPASSTDFSKRGKVFLEMLNNCLDQIRCPSIEHRVFMRCDVNFNMSARGKNLNTFIGRAAHIEFLETDIFAKFIMWSFQELFQ